jgi:hypothetical protein
MHKEDISMAAGGPMGSPTIHLSSRVFKTLAAAQACAQKEIRANKLSWLKSKSGPWQSADYGGEFQYTIEEVDLEEEGDPTGVKPHKRRFS